MVRIFDDEVEGGVTSGGSMAYVIRLEGVFASHPIEYFTKKLGNRRAGEEAASKREIWYGVVDGGHRNEALRQLVCTKPAKWGGFLWTVTVLKTIAPLATYRSFARVCNLRQEEDFIVERTQYDVLRNLKDDYNTLFAAKNVKPKLTDVAEYYSGGKQGCTNTIRQLTSCAVKLSDEVIETLGTILNSEHKELAMQSLSKLGGKGNRKGVDSRVYRKIVSTSTLKQSKVFMSAEGDDADELRICTLWRIK